MEGIFVTVLEENEKLNIEIKKIIENLNSENKKSKKKNLLFSYKKAKLSDIVLS